MRTIQNKFSGVLAALALLASCGGQPERPEPERTQAAAPLPEDVANALLPSVQVGLAQRGGAERRFDVNVRDMDARTFFLSVVEGTPYSVILSPRLSGNITLALQNITVPEILDAVRDVYGYDFQRNGLTYTVLPAEVQTRTFQVNYLNLKRQGHSRTRVTSGQITETLGTGGSATGSAGRQGDRTAVSVAGSNIETSTESDFWKELEASLRLIVKERAGYSLAINAESGVVVVRATPSVLRDVADFLRAVHGNLHRQVVLETKIVEVSLKDAFQAGINWASLSSPGDGTALVGQVGGQNVFNSGLSDIAGSALNITPGNPVAGFASTATGGAFLVALDFADFNAVIEFLKSQGDVQVLSSPQISTVNNQKAIIKVGTDEFFVTGVQSNQTAGGGATTNNQQIEITPFFSGIALDVTPRIYGVDEVILHVHPTVSEVREQPKNLVVGGQAQQLPLALSSLRETDSIVRARSGQVVVIGGLMQDKVTDERFATPILGDIPLLGLLFRQTRRVTIKSELVVLMKPVVMDSDANWSEATRASRQRLERMGSKFSSSDTWMNRP